MGAIYSDVIMFVRQSFITFIAFCLCSPVCYLHSNIRAAQGRLLRACDGVVIIS